MTHKDVLSQIQESRNNLPPSFITTISRQPPTVWNLGGEPQLYCDAWIERSETRKRDSVQVEEEIVLHSSSGTLRMKRELARVIVARLSEALEGYAPKE